MQVLTAVERTQIVALKGQKTATQLAQQFNCTKSCVKMVWMNHRRAGMVTVSATKRAFGQTHSARTGMVTGESHAVEEVPPDPVVDTGKNLLSLEMDECRWPIGVDVDGHYRFCACGCSDDSDSYCPQHEAASRGAAGGHAWTIDTWLASHKPFPIAQTLTKILGNRLDVASPDFDDDVLEQLERVA